ncbi:helix-turn-helix domain-containing protein [uncultured Aquimarina sp.]|uniref:helix-turn-helix domain-containing protein n=1 Tax=uncultured Aquimarina sp. TaxID=575652 RepID=UPI00260DD63A|nr:helix-turn-helix domain-containing protein [uncultured Aquimarina sp.]
MIFFSAFLFQDTIPISIGPFLFLYVKSIFFSGKNVIKKNYKHFLIPVLYLLFASIPKLISLIKSPDTFGHLRVGLENLWALSNINSLLYCIVALKLLSRAKKIVKLYYANIDSTDLNWLQNFLYGTIIIIGIDISITIFEVLYGDINSAIGIIAIFVVFLIVYLAYKGISQTKVLLPEFLLKEGKTQKKTEQQVSPITNPKKQVYDPKEMHLLQQNLEDLIYNTKLYLNPELSLKSIAKELLISEKKLSYLLNQHMKVSFYDYINYLRVEEVKQKILDPSYAQYTLLGIALDCGFNSKTSFNRTFQRFEGVTPSKFRRSLAQT